MYYYLFDQRRTKTISPKQLDQIKSWIKTSPIAGQQFDLASPQLIMEKARELSTKHPTATMAVIGDDLSLDLAISGIQKTQNRVTLGYIPVVASASSTLLGLKDWRQSAKTLQQRKTKDFNLFDINGYAILSQAELTSKADDASPNQDAPISTISLDSQLKLITPAYRCSISSLAHQKDYHEHPHTCLIEVYNLPKFGHKIHSKVPLIRTKLTQFNEVEEVLIRLPFNQADITPQRRLLLNNLVPLSGTIKISRHPQAQSMIIARNEGPSA